MGLSPPLNHEGREERRGQDGAQYPRDHHPLIQRDYLLSTSDPFGLDERLTFFKGIIQYLNPSDAELSDIKISYGPDAAAIPNECEGSRWPLPNH